MYDNNILKHKMTINMNKFSDFVLINNILVCVLLYEFVIFV